MRFHPWLSRILLCQVLMVAMVACSDVADLPEVPADCQSDPKPMSGTLKVLVSIDSRNLQVPVTIYRGKFEDNHVFLEDTLTVGRFDYEVPVDQSYSATATYLAGQDTILVIDEHRVYVTSEDYRNGDERITCYTLHNGTVDLRIRDILSMSLNPGRRDKRSSALQLDRRTGRK